MPPATPPILLTISYLFLIAAWTMTHPPGAAPDEFGHYLRAVAAGRGELAPDERPPPATDAERAEAAVRWQRRQTRMVKVQGSLSPENFDCIRNAPLFSWKCPDPGPPPHETFELRSVQGTYPPYPYLLPGLAGRLGDDAVSALLWGRAASAFSAWLLLAIATLVLWDGNNTQFSLVGPIVAVTPMVIFVASSLSGSGLETAAGVCFFACLMRLTRPGEVRSRGLWTAAGISGALLVLSRDLGIAWAGLGLSAALALCGFTAFREAAASGGKRAVAAGGALGAAAIGAGIWQVSKQVHPPLDPSRMAQDFPSSLRITKEIFRQEIGVFGWLDTVMPPWAYVIWVSVTFVLLGLALFAGGRRERSVLAVCMIGAVLVPVAVDLAQRGVGFGAQGRHVLPITVAVPLLAGEILIRRSDRLRWLQSLGVPFWIGTAAGTVHLVAWYLDAKRPIVGFEGPFWFWRGIDSTPPLGWALWAAIAAAGSLLVCSAGLAAWVSSIAERRRAGTRMPRPLDRPRLSSH